MHPKRLRKNWRRALKSNLTRISGLLRRRGPLNTEAVHDLRVGLRRARLLLQLRSKHQDRDRIKRFRAEGRRIMDAFAPPRDADVALNWAKERHASPNLLTHLMHERTRLCRRAERQLVRIKPKLRANRVKTSGKVDAEKLNRRFHRWLGAISARCLSGVNQAPQFTIPELHALRRDIRRWRYLRELATTCRPVARDRIVRALVAAQESLGLIQDTEAILRQLQSCGRSREVMQMKRDLRRELESRRKAALEELARFAKHPAIRKLQYA
jgi:CHAD domain-containing protein